jgi:hypothetical protein
MNPFEDPPRTDTRQRVDAAVVWTATAGALVCSVLLFLATNQPSVNPVAEPAPSLDWQPPVTTTPTVGTATPDTPGPSFEAVAPPQDTTVTSRARAATGTAVAPPPSSPPPPPPPPSPPAEPTAPPSAGPPLHAVGSGKCLDVPNASTTPGAQLQIWACSGRSNQAWTRTSSGQLTVTIAGVTRCLDAYGQQTQPGTQVITWPCNGQVNQRWRFHSDGTITGVQSGLCLDVTGASVANGAPVQLWTCNGQSNQRWDLG